MHLFMMSKDFLAAEQTADYKIKNWSIDFFLNRLK